MARASDNSGLTAQLDDILHPRSIAIVGLSRRMTAGKVFLISLLEQGFPGRIYPVHPEAHEIDGLKAFPSVTAVPGPVDIAIILVPHRATLRVLQECANKGVKGAILFSAGYKETGTEEGKTLQAELSRLARSSGMRLFGPNCMGVYCPKTGLSFFPGLSKQPGTVGFVSHSGSLAMILARMGPQKGIRFSKVVSLGNECDLTCSDLLDYLGNDPETEAIGAYVEGVQTGRYFVDALKGASRKKPVVLWKAGLTPEGGKAAASHTGALAGSHEIWSAVINQSGAVSVVGLDALADTLMAFSLFPPNLGDRMAILAGPGGMAVGAADACANQGLRLAELSPSTRSRLSGLVPPAGTSISNPVDIGLSASVELDIYSDAALTLAADPGVDAIVVLGGGLDRESDERYTKSLIEVHKNLNKPFMIVKIPGFDPAFAQQLCSSGIPFFDSAEQAMAAYARVRAYQLWQKKDGIV